MLTQASPELSEISKYSRLDPARILRIYKKLNIRSVDALKEKLANGDIEKTLGNALAVVHAIQGQNWLEFPVGRVLFRTPGALSQPRFSAEGQRIAFIEHPVRHDDAGSVLVVDLGGHVEYKLSDWSSISGLAWHPRTHEVWFTAARKGSLRSVWA